MSDLRIKAEELLGEKYKKLNPGEPYVLWTLDCIPIHSDEIVVIKKNPVYYKAALLKLAMDCKIPNGRIEDVKNECVYGFIQDTLVALILPSACLTKEEMKDLSKFTYQLK